MLQSSIIITTNNIYINTVLIIINILYRNSLWPDGVRATEVQFRDAEVQLRTLVAAKCALLSSVSGKSLASKNID